MKIIETNGELVIYTDAFKVHDKIPSRTYEICFGEMRGFYLKQGKELTVSEKLYGNIAAKMDMVRKGYDAMDRSLGVLMSGDKGLGKSIASRYLCHEMNLMSDMPVIIVSTPYKGIANFIRTIDQELVVLFDEFEKMFRDRRDGSDQNEFLSLFDGLDTQKRMYIVTCNEIRDVSSYLLNRPGRFHYHIRFTYPTPEEVKEYLGDKIKKKYSEQITEAVEFSKRIHLSYDCLRAIAFEINLGRNFRDFINNLNIIRESNGFIRYDVIAKTKDGQVYQGKKMLNLSLANGERFSVYLHSKKDDKKCIELMLEDSSLRYSYESNSYTADPDSCTAVDENGKEIKIESIEFKEPSNRANNMYNWF